MRLITFYNEVTSWPQSTEELEASASLLRSLFSSPVVFIKAGQSKTYSIDPVLSQAVNELERLQQFDVEQEMPTIKYIKNDGPTSVKVPFLAFVHFVAHGKNEDRKCYGWLAIGVNRVGDDSFENILLAIAQQFVSLAVVSEMETLISQRDQFLSVASHELKTPLTSIYGMLQLQERLSKKSKSGLDPEKAKAYAQITIRQVERLNELIDGLLDVSRIQNGRFAVQPTETNATALFDEVVNSRLQIIGQEAGVGIEVQRPDSIDVWLDPIRFQEVVTNLGMNAIRYSPEGGTVSLRLADEQDELTMTVQDQGPTLAESDRERVFQPFERAQRTSRLGGLGLGLYISREIAQLHGGTVTLLPSPQKKGNVFKAVFPKKNRLAC